MTSEWNGHEGAVTVVRLGMDYGSTQADQLSNLQTMLMRCAEEAGPRGLLLDLSETEFFGSMFLNVLLTCHACLNDRGVPLALCCVHPLLREELEAANLDRLWPIYESPEAAIAAVAHDHSTSKNVVRPLGRRRR